MNWKHTATVALFALLSQLVVIGCQAPATTETKSTPVAQTTTQVTPVVLRVAEAIGPTGARQDIEKEMLNLVEQRTGGRVKFEVYWSESLAKSKEALSAISTGLADVGTIPCAYHPSELLVTLYGDSSPFQQVSQVDLNKIYWEMQDTFPAIKNEFSTKWNQLPFTLWGYAASHILTTSKPIKTLKDLQGLVIRTSSRTQEIALKTIGGASSSMAITEIFEGMQRGTIDGAVMTLDQMPSTGASQVGKYLLLVNFAPASMGYFNINKNTFERLPKDVQQVILDTGKEESIKYSSAVDKQQDDYLKAFLALPGREVFRLPPEEMSKWINSPELVGMPLSVKKSFNDRGYPGDAMIDTYLAKLRQYSIK